MKNTRIALRYSKALFELAVEQNVLEQVHKDMVLVYEVCESNKDFTKMLANPIIKSDKKQAVISLIFKEHLHKMSLAFLLIIARKRREILIEEMSKQFIGLYKNYKGIKPAVIETAVRIDDKIKEKIAAMLKAAIKFEIELTEKINPDLIGGFKLTYDDKSYDASISNKIKKLTSEFEVNVYEKGY